MNENLTQTLQMDSQEYQQMAQQILNQTLQSLPKAKVPSWLEAFVEYVKVHPLESLIIFCVIVLLIAAIIRELACAYFKTNEIVSRLKKLEEKIK